MKVALKPHLNGFPRLRCQLSSLKLMLQLLLSHCLNTYTLLILLIALTLLTLFITSLRPTDVEIQGMAGGTKQITLPLEEPSEVSGQNSKTYILTGSFSSALFSQHVVHIIPDDCVESLQINGVNVDLHKVIQGNTCDWRNGFDIDVKNYLKEGTNPFEIRLIDYGGSFGLCIQHSSYDKLYFVLLQMLIVEIATLLSFFLKNHLQLPNSIVLVMLLGLFLRLLYLSYTPYDVRTYDVLGYGAHLDYIKYVANHLQLPDPKPSSGWEYYQAPLYYIIAAILYKIATNLSFDTFLVLQVLSLMYSTVFLIFGVLISRRVCKRKWVFFTCTALLVFWPSGIIHAIRIGNDPMYYMFSVITVYFLMRWLRDKENHTFYIAALFAALTIATKLNGMLVVAMVGMFLVSIWLKTKQKRSYVIKTAFFISVVFLASSSFLIRNLGTALHDTHFNLFVGNMPVGLNNISVGNTLYNYVYFDLHTYLTQAFTDVWSDAGGRQYFWNYFLKTVLFGEFSFSSAIGQWVAIMLSILLLLMILFSIFGLLVNIISFNACKTLMILWFLLSLSSLLYYRHSYPYSNDQDFRFIFPAIIPFIYFYVTGIDFFIERKLRIVGIFGYILAYLFILGTCFFFLIPLGG